MMAMRIVYGVPTFYNIVDKERGTVLEVVAKSKAQYRKKVLERYFGKKLALELRKEMPKRLAKLLEGSGK